MFRLSWLAAFMLLAGSANATVLLNETFDSSATGLNVAPTGWTSTNGTVDTFSNGDYGLPCAGGSGRCVDLDGSTRDAGELTYNTLFTLTSGVQYTLSYMLAGSQRGDSNTVTITFGGQTQTRTMASSDGFTLYSLVFTPGTTLLNQQIKFANAGGDNYGALLDNVKLEFFDVRTSEVPEPSSGLLLLAAFASVPMVRRFMR